MCGIAGEIKKTSAAVPHAAAVSESMGAIQRRGPDSHGWVSLKCHGHSVLLEHARLSIIELSDLGHQPMQDSVSGWWVIYNGEIYNYPEVRDELLGLGWTFRSNSDTEVLLKAWAQWGLAALPRFNGMFAFSAFHPPSGRLWLVRDRFGVKPLSWGVGRDGEVIFSSSVAGIAARVGSELDLDYCARAARYKVYETGQSGSPFKRVKNVPAGGWIRFDIGGEGVAVREGKWYELGKAVQERAHTLRGFSDELLVELCSDVLESAVRLRLRSDVPLAVSLSGGLDSSAVAALASGMTEGLHAFTYGSPGALASEGPEVKAFGEAVGVQVTYVWPRHDAKALDTALERTLLYHEAPFAGLSPIAQNEVFQAVRQAGFKVLLGGQGGDEIFAGYRKFFVVALRDAIRSRDPAGVLHMAFSLGLMLAHEARRAGLYWENRNRYRNKEDSGFRLLDWRADLLNLWGAPGATLAERQIEDVLQWSLPTLLRYEDRNSMGFGVESRLPFMDYRLVEIALALPARLKIRNGFGKWALRAITAQSVPDFIRLNRIKRGFDVTQAWIRGGLGASLRSRILDNRSRLAEHLKTGIALDRMLSDSSLSQDGNLLCEALMLAWLVKPVRLPAAASLERTNREKDLPLFIRP